MRFCDEVAGIAAVRHSGLRVVTAAMDRMTFLQPVHVGQLLTVHASVNAAWRTSMEVGVRVTAEDVRNGDAWHVSTAYLTMVALDAGPAHADRRRSRPRADAEVTARPRGPAAPRQPAGRARAASSSRAGRAPRSAASRPPRVACSARSCSSAER